MGDEKLFRVGPGSGEWICYDALLDELWKWSSRPAGTGLPAITISKRDEEPAEEEEDAWQGPVFVMAGNYQEYLAWCRVNDRRPTDQANNRYLKDVYMLRGVSNPRVEYYGTYDERRDLLEVQRLIRVRTPVTQEWLDEWNARPTGADVSDLIELVPVTDQPADAECACGILRAGPGRHLPECPGKPDTDRPGAETGFVCKCPQGCCGHGQQKAVAALCGCDPAPHREEDGTYSHYAGCPVADAQQKFGHHVD